MRICSRCVLPETFPGISFDSEGTCSFCKSAADALRDDQKRSLEKRFLEAIDRVRGVSPFDCIVAYSGGKDSSYLLDLLVTQYDLKVLAVTFDNWFLSEMAFSNMRSITRSLNVSHMVIRPPYELMKALFREASQRELYSRKSLERASTICTTCISFVRFSCLRTAMEKGVRLVVFGFNPGQAPESAAIIATNGALLQALQQAVYGPISKIVGNAAQPFFLEKEHFDSKSRFPCIVNPFTFVDYREENIFSRIRQIGWQQVTDTDENSTNCLMNSYANLLHYGKYGFHPYASEIANMVRRGRMDREEGLSRIKPPEVNQIVTTVSKQLNE